MQGRPHFDSVEQVPTQAVLPLRHRVLRPGRPLDTCYFAGDERATHLVIRQGTAVVAISTWLTNPHPTADGGAWWQLRGMAVAPELQGSGVGSALLKGATQWLVELGANQFWCNARCAAQPFYERAGWQVVSARFDIALVGPHVVMQRCVTEAAREGLAAT